MSTVYGDLRCDRARPLPQRSTTNRAEPASTIQLNDDGETITVTDLTIRSRSLHGRLTGLDPLQQATILLDAIDTGTLVLSRAAQHGDLENFGRAIERLDEQSKRIVAATTDEVNRTIDKTIAEMAATIQGDDGPLAGLLAKFDPGQRRQRHRPVPQPRFEDGDQGHQAGHR